MHVSSAMAVFYYGFIEETSPCSFTGRETLPYDNIFCKASKHHSLHFSFSRAISGKSIFPCLRNVFLHGNKEYFPICGSWDSRAFHNSRVKDAWKVLSTFCSWVWIISFYIIMGNNNSFYSEDILLSRLLSIFALLREAFSTFHE